MVWGIGLASVAIGFACADTKGESLRPDWDQIFDDAKVDGTMVVLDLRSDERSTMICNPERAKTRCSPASTFKIPHTLFALDAGIVRNEFEVIKWDRTERSYPVWNADQNLRSAMRYSVVWVYQGFATELGDARERDYMTKINYGNAETSGTDPFWVKGDLAISPIEQITFLEKLYGNDLPFKESHQRLVKDIMIVDADSDWVLRAKSGWNGTIGWFVGWVDCATGPVFFALNIDTPNRLDDLPKRESISRAVLQSLGALPPAVDDSPTSGK